jgi:hypothetical protein
MKQTVLNSLPFKFINEQNINMYNLISNVLKYKYILPNNEHFNVHVELNPLPVQFKSLLPGQEGCVFFSGHLNVCKYHYTLIRLGRQAAFKSTTL